MSFAPNTSNEGIITFAPIITADNYNAGPAYEIHYSLHPDNLKADCINKALRAMRYPTYWPLGLLTNADMEDATITTVWLEKESDKPTVAENTTAANVYRGQKSMSVTDSNVGDEYAYQAFNVIAGESMYLFAFGRTSAAATEAQVIAYDATTGAAIDTWDLDDLEWQEMGGKITIPASCKSAQVRLNIVTAEGVAYFDDVQCYSENQKEFTLPAWITHESQIGDVYYLPEGSPGPDEGRMVNETELRYVGTPKILGSGGRFTIEVRGANIGRPLYLETYRHYAELSADIDTTNADRDAVVEGALHFAYKMKGKDFRREAKEHGDKWMEMRRGEPDFGCKWG